VAVTARKVVERLREQPVRRAAWIHPAWVRIAAAVVILLGSAIAVRQVHRGGQSAQHVAHFVADDLNDLSIDELRDVLTSIDVTTDSVAVPEDSTDLRALDARQLRAMLRDLEG
jgi:hypothetical protein